MKPWRVSPQSCRSLAMVEKAPADEHFDRHGAVGAAALVFLPIATAIGGKTRLASHPDPHYHKLARVMQSVLNLKKWRKYATKRDNFSAIYPGLVYGGKRRLTRDGVDVMPWNGL